MDQSLSKREYQVLAQSVTNYVLTIDPYFRISLCNDLVRRDFPISLDKTCYQAWKNRQYPCPDCPVRQCFENGKVMISEENLILRDGRAACFEVKATPVKNDLGEILSVIMVATDADRIQQLTQEWGHSNSLLNEQMAQRLETLQASEKKYRTIFERSPDIIILLDSNLRIVDINPAGLKLLEGYGQEEILGLDSFGALFEKLEDFEGFRARLLRRGRVQDLETFLVTKFAALAPVLISANAISDQEGRIHYFEVNVRDIYLMRLKEEVLKKQNLQLAMINEILETLSQSRILDQLLNQVADRLMDLLQGNSFRIYLLGEKKEHLNLAVARGLTEDFLSKPFVQRRPLTEGFLGMSAETCRTIVIGDFEKTGNRFLEDLEMEEIRSAAYIPLLSKGALVGVLSTTSSRKDKFTQQDINFLNAIGHSMGMVIENLHLFEQTRRAYQELKVAQEQILHREKLASLGKQAATIAHEINNPISSVLTYIKLMRRILTGPPFPEQRVPDLQRYLKTMETETARCGEIVKNLLGFSRQTKPKKEWVDFSRVFEKAVALMNHNLNLKGITVIQNPIFSIPLVPCDAKQMQQVFVNLIGNAAEAMPQGGVITLEASYQPAANQVLFQIRDNGIGIPPEHLPNIFEPFFTTKDEIKGVGLGLSVVHGIISEHGGQITVESRPGEGTCFSIRLPTNNRESDPASIEDGVT